LAWAQLRSSSTLGGPFNLIFIDGSHTEAYVRSDSENAVKHLAPRGDYELVLEDGAT
jgi:hypothetical protein